MTAAGPENVPTTDLSDLPGRYGTVEMDPQPVPGAETVTVDRAWFEAAMKRGVPLTPIPDGCVRVSVEDEECETEVSIVGPDDYAVIAVGDCHVANLQAFGNGTHVLTVKGRR